MSMIDKRLLKRRLRRKLDRLFFCLSRMVFWKHFLPIKKINPSKIKRILLTRYDGLGDMIVTTAIFEAIKQLNPAIEIDVIASDRNVSLIENDPRVSNYVVFRNWKQFFPIALKIRWKKQYDIFFSFVGPQSVNESILANLIAPNAIKVSFRVYNKYRPFFNVFSKEHEEAWHILDKLHNALFEVIAASKKTADPKIIVPQQAKHLAAEFISTHNLKRFIILNTSAGKPHCIWGISNNQEFLIRFLNAHPEIQVVVLSQPDTVSEVKNMIEQINNERVIQYPVFDSVLPIAALMDCCEMVISPDTSIVHLAAAQQKPVLGLYTKMTGIQAWYPYHVANKLVIMPALVPVSAIPVESVLDAYKIFQEELSVLNP
jgi:ADP-heptose:LPS heptosyltransferase